MGKKEEIGSGYAFLFFCTGMLLGVLGGSNLQHDFSYSDEK
jgi:hypothetical protein